VLSVAALRYIGLHDCLEARGCASGLEVCDKSSLRTNLNKPDAIVGSRWSPVSKKKRKTEVRRARSGVETGHR
jgi:hypothetical protein